MHFLIVFLILISAFLGPYFFILIPQLHLIRIAPAFLLLSGIVLNLRIRLSGAVLAIFWFFTIYFVYSFLLTLYHLPDVGVNNLINFVVLIIFVYSIFFSLGSAPVVFFKALRIAVLIFVVSSVALAVYEEMTLNHLHLSAMQEVPKRWPQSHFPTAFFTNPNDFAAVFSLSVMFLVTHVDSRQGGIKKNLALGCLFASWAWVIMVTESRVNLICFVIFVAFYFRFWRAGFIGFITIGCALILSVFPEILTQLKQRSASLLDFSFTPGESLSERLNIIQYGVESIFYSNTLGLGVGSAQGYYSQFIGKGLTGSTVDPHNYILELLINSGLWMLILYLGVSVLIFWHMLISGANRLIVVQFALYNFVLLSSSSSVFLWPHYVFFIAYTAYKMQVIDFASPLPDIRSAEIADHQ